MTLVGFLDLAFSLLREGILRQRRLLDASCSVCMALCGQMPLQSNSTRQCQVTSSTGEAFRGFGFGGGLTCGFLGPVPMTLVPSVDASPVCRLVGFQVFSFCFLWLDFGILDCPCSPLLSRHGTFSACDLFAEGEMRTERSPRDYVTTLPGRHSFVVSVRDGWKCSVEETGEECFECQEASSRVIAELR